MAMTKQVVLPRRGRVILKKHLMGPAPLFDFLNSLDRDLSFFGSDALGHLSVTVLQNLSPQFYPVRPH
jgi:hypothetical protein